MFTALLTCTFLSSMFLFTDTDGMLSQALLVGNFEAAVDICISADRMVSKIHMQLYLCMCVHLLFYVHVCMHG